MKQSDILVIIVAYNSLPWAKRCYDSLRQSTVPCDVITIDNGSTDGTQDFIRTNYPEVEFHETHRNLGFGQANNIGLQKALDEGYEYAYLLNQDAWILPNTLSNLVAVSQQHPEYGVLSPFQMKADLQQLDDKFATYTIGTHQQQRPLLCEDLYLHRLAPVYEVTFVMAAHWLITRSCLEVVGGFSPTFFIYGEDDNYLHRTMYRNFKIGIVPSAQAIHDRSNPVWDENKQLYISHYTMALDKCSNPKNKWSIWYFIRTYLWSGLRTRKKAILKYAIRLFKERKTIEQNYQKSFLSRAFLS